MVRRLKEDRSKKEKRSLKNILYKDDNFAIKYSPPMDDGGLETIKLLGRYEKESFSVLIHRDDEGFFYNIESHKGSKNPKTYLGGTDLKDNTCLVDKEMSYFLKEARKKLDGIKEQKIDQLKAIKVDYASKLVNDTIQHRINLLNNKKKFYR